MRASKRNGTYQGRKFHNDGYHELFMQSPEAKLLIEPLTGIIIEANNAASKLYGRSNDDLVTCSLYDLHHGSHDILKEQINKIQGGGTASFHLSYLYSSHKSKVLAYTLQQISLEDRMYILFNVEDYAFSKKNNEVYYQQTEMLRNTLDSIDDLLFALNKDGDFLEYYQPSGGTTLSMASNVFVGKNIYDIGFPLDVAKKYLQTIDSVTEEDKPAQIDYYLEAFGTRLWYNARITPRKNAFGEIEGVTVLCRDVTRQKRNEETLKKARDFYQTLLADFPSMIWKTNALRRSDYFNKTWLEFTGNLLDDEMKIDWTERIHPNDIDEFLFVLQKAYKTKEAFQIEHRMKHRSGRYRWVINAGRPFYNLDGQFSGFIGSCYDITDRKRADDMLHLQKSAMDSALEGIMIINDDDRNYPVIYANKELSKLTGTDQEDIIANSFLSILGNSLDEQMERAILKALKEKKSYKGEFPVHFDNDFGFAKWRLLYISPVRDRDKIKNHFIAVLIDITETKGVEKTLLEKNKELQKTNEELDSFVYSTSHELRSPLMSVLGLLNLLDADLEEQEKTTYLNMIRESISRLDNIIHDIIDYSRNSRIDVSYEKVNFDRLTESVLHNFKYVEHYDQIDFQLSVDNKGSFLSDAKRIQIIINNLVSNAIKFHNVDQQHPFVKIAIRSSSVNAIITVTDNGTGIHDKHMSRLYDMFYRGSEQSKGSGIGLYIVKEIVDKLKGTIKVNSSPGKGTTFTIDLPSYINKNYKMSTMVAAYKNNS